MKKLAYILEAIYNLTGVIHYHIKGIRVRSKSFIQKHYTAIGTFCALVFFSVLFADFMIFIYENFPLQSWGLALYIFALLIGTWFFLFLLKLFIQEAFPKYRAHLKSSQEFPFRNRLKTLEGKVAATAQKNGIRENHSSVKTSLKFDDLFLNTDLRDMVISVLKKNRIVDENGNWIPRCLGNNDVTAVCILIWKLESLQLIRRPGKLTYKELCELSSSFFQFEKYHESMLSKVFGELKQTDIVGKSNYAPVLKQLDFLEDLNKV